MSVGEDLSAEEQGRIDLVDKDFAKVGNSLKVKVSGNEAFEFTATLEDNTGSSVGSVTPSSGTLDSEFKTELSISLPSKSGDYQLKVKFLRGEEEVYTFPDFPLRAVDPIILKAKVTNTKDADVEFYAYFIINDEKVDDSEQLVSVKANDSTEVTYEYIVRDTADIEYTVDSDDDLIKGVIEGLGVKHHVYASKTDFMPITVIEIVVIVALIIAGVFIIRKPVINTGKPKSRR